MMYKHIIVGLVDTEQMVRAHFFRRFQYFWLHRFCSTETLAFGFLPPSFLLVEFPSAVGLHWLYRQANPFVGAH